MSNQYLTKEEAGRTIEKKQIVVDRELTKLIKKHKTLNEEIVLEEAKRPSSPLHDFFEWDDSIAANNYRRQQAMALILASKMVVVLQENNGRPPTVAHAEKPEVRRLVNAFRGEGFKLRTDALANDGMRTALVEKYKGKLRGWCHEAVDIEELQDLRNAILEKLGE